jgi:hypothetical protein
LPRRVAGAFYLIASIGFVVVFSWLASAFGYPDVLDHPAAEVLPALRALGNSGRAVWALYAVLPLLLIPAAVAGEAVLGPLTPTRMRAATLLQLLAAIAMFLGLARWPSVQWLLAEAWASAAASERAVMALAFDAANLYLGNWIGEFVGEIGLYGAFLAIGSSLRVAAWEGVLPTWGRWIGALGLLTGAVGLLAAFRNVTTAVALAAEAANALLPLFLIAYGVLLVWPHTVPSLSQRTGSRDP